MTSVVASNLGKEITERQVSDFFSFCGKIQSIKLEPDGEKQKATIVFERPSAARTALLLQEAHLGASQVHVTALGPLDEASTPPAESSKSPGQDFRQEDKPRTAVFAGTKLKRPKFESCVEYLSHGYSLTDQALHKAIEYDHSHGLSKRFFNLLNHAVEHVQGVDHKLGVTQRATAVDEKYGIQGKAKSTATGLLRYFENALDTPTGKKVRAFYQDRKKEILDIHNEARRLAEERKRATPTEGPSTTAAPVEGHPTGAGDTVPPDMKKA